MVFPRTSERSARRWVQGNLVIFLPLIGNLKDRLKKYLLDVATINESRTVPKTHHEIAYALNTSRVVVSRVLKSLEMEGFLQLNRNSLTILG